MEDIPNPSRSRWKRTTRLALLAAAAGIGWHVISHSDVHLEYRARAFVESLGGDVYGPDYGPQWLQELARRHHVDWPLQQITQFDMPFPREHLSLLSGYRPARSGRFVWSRKALRSIRGLFLDRPRSP